MAKTWSIATHAFKALKRHARQSNKHVNGTEMACRMIPNHQNLQSWHATLEHTQGQQAQIQRSYIMHAKINPNDYGQS